MRHATTVLRAARPILFFIFVVYVTGCSSIDNLDQVLNNTAGGDVVAPIVSITSHTNGQEVGGVYTLTGLVSDAGSGVSKVYLSVDGGPYGAVTVTSGAWTATVSLSLCGPHTNTVYAVDKAGNESETVSVFITRDTIPAITIDGIADYNAYNTWTLNIGGTVSIDAPYTITETALSVNGGDYTNVGNTVWTKNAVALNPNATNTLRARAIGSNGRTNETPLMHVIVDMESPLLSATIAEYTNRTAFDLPISVIENLSGLSSLMYRVNGGSYVPVAGTNASFSGLSEGVNAITIYGVDNAGNTTNISITTIVNTNGIYVATNGNDTNFGATRDKPVRTIQVGIDNAVALGIPRVHVAQGLYIPGAGLNVSNSGVVVGTGVKLFGGYNQDLHERTGKSTLDGTNGLYHIIYVSGGSIVIDGFNVLRGNANGPDTNAYGGGIYCQSLSGSLFTNICVYSNSAAAGGGIYLNFGSINNFYGNIYCNTAANGGGLYINSMFSSSIAFNNSSNNVTVNGGGAYINQSCNNNTISGNISYNNANSDGGGVYAYHAVSSKLCGDILNNNAVNGGGVFCNLTIRFIVSGNISGNTAGSGGGVYIYMPSTGTKLSNAILTNNSAANGVITLANFPMITISECLIGGTGATGYGICETIGNTTGHILSNNTFITNKIAYLYFDGIRGNIGITEINKLNSTNIGGINYTTAAVAMDNKVINQ